MISCKEYVAKRKAELKEKIEGLDCKPRLAVIQVGDNPASNSYISGKRKDCEEIGIQFEFIKLNDDVSISIISCIIKQLNHDSSVDGIILQLPLPDRFQAFESYLTQLITPDKDVDGFTVQSPFRPCTPEGIIRYLAYNDYEFCGKNALVIGRSNIVGKPLAQMLLEKNCTVTVAHSKTSNANLNTYIKNADIVFTCIDKIEYFEPDEDMVQKWFNTDIIDIGLGRNENGLLRGNMNHSFAESLQTYNKNRIIISGIGGVGLLTRCELLQHTYDACIANTIKGAF